MRIRFPRRTSGVVLGVALLLGGVLPACTPPPPPPATLTFHYFYNINVHDETGIGYSHLYNTITITVDPYGTVTNMTGTLETRGYGIESYSAGAHPDGDASVYVGPTANVKGWTTYITSTTHWSLTENYLGANWTFAHCTWNVQIAVESGGGVQSSYAYPLDRWTGSCGGNQYLSKAS